MWEWLTVSKATPRGRCSLLALPIKSCRSFQCSEHPADLINPLCLTLMGQALVSRAVRIFKNNLKTVEPMVIGCQLLKSIWHSGKANFEISTVRRSLTTAGTVPDTSHKLRSSISWVPWGSILIRSLKLSPSGPSAEFLLLSDCFLRFPLPSSWLRMPSCPRDYPF